MLNVLALGRFANAALDAGEGEVCAVFDRSVYLRGRAGGLACLGGSALGRGPLNACLSQAPDFRSLKIGQTLSVSLSQACLWRPDPAPGPPLPPRFERRVAKLCVEAGARAPKSGLGGCIARRSSDLLRAAQPGMMALDLWLGSSERTAPLSRTAGLIGLGPGLTPSGDDYLGGALVALRALGESRRAAQLWRWLAPLTRTRTSEISRAHLEAAAAGEAHEALHACLNALWSERAPRWQPLLERLDRVGHCSGWDGLAGALAVARRAPA